MQLKVSAINTPIDVGRLAPADQESYSIESSKTWSSHRAVGPMGRRLGQLSPPSADWLCQAKRFKA